MHGHRIGYVWVSSFDPNPERQLEVLDHGWWLNKQVKQGEFRPRPPLNRP